MKPTLLIATLSLAFATPQAFAKSELETLRALCQEQKRQISELEETNERLRSGGRESQASPTPKTETISAAIAKTNSSAATTSTYTVKAGDNFDKIARKVGTNPTALAMSNGMTTRSIIRPGQKLKVPGATAPTTPEAATASTSAPRTSGRTHKVQPGDTFSSISRKHGISTRTLAAANPKAKASALRPGQIINLGAGAPATTMISAPAPVKSPPAVEKSPPATPAAITKSPPARDNVPVSNGAPAGTAAIAETKTAAAQETVSSSPEKKIRPVTIDGEMTYGEFASKHGTDAERLNALNGLDLTTATVLAKGSELYVPAQP